MASAHTERTTIRKGVVTSKGTPLSLVGPDLQVGDRAPDFQVVDNDLRPVRLSDFRGQLVLLSVTPSVDTRVCDLQARRFNEIATGLSQDVVILNVSLDLPFALSRWCAATGSERIRTLSDYRDRDFGLKFGMLVDETRLLARAVWIIDGEGIIRYREVVPEISHQPDFDAALVALRKLTA